MQARRDGVVGGAWPKSPPDSGGSSLTPTVSAVRRRRKAAGWCATGACSEAAQASLVSWRLRYGFCLSMSSWSRNCAYRVVPLQRHGGLDVDDGYSPRRPATRSGDGLGERAHSMDLRYRPPSIIGEHRITAHWGTGSRQR